jgi:HlyD family secretion protein
MAKKNNATRKIVYAIAGVVGILVVFLVVGRMTGLLGGGNEVVEVEAVKAEIRDVTQVVTASGKIRPEVEVKISPDVSGEIIDLRVNEGDHVQQGDLLVRIKPDFYLAQVEQAQAGVSQARANLEQRKADLLHAELEFNRQQDLHNRGVISESDFLATKTQYEVAKAAYSGAEYAVASAEARLREVQEQLSKTSIYAPMTGTISQLNVELGERVVGTSQMAGTEMMRIAKLDLMEIEVDVNENDVVNVSIGDSATIEIDAYAERVFKGNVTEIANSARIMGAGTQEQVTNFPVKIRVLETYNVGEGSSLAAASVASDEVPLPTASSVTLRPGMSGTVDIFTETIHGAIAIPIQAVTVRDVTKVKQDSTSQASAEKPNPDNEATKEDLRKVVFVVEDGKVRMQEVETSISDDTHIVVTSGLAGDELVVTGPYSAVSRILEPGMAVKVKEDDSRRTVPVMAVTR